VFFLLRCWVRNHIYLIFFLFLFLCLVFLLCLCTCVLFECWFYKWPGTAKPAFSIIWIEWNGIFVMYKNKFSLLIIFIWTVTILFMASVTWCDTSLLPLLCVFCLWFTFMFLCSLSLSLSLSLALSLSNSAYSFAVRILILKNWNYCH
jgi:hypothetical protein